MSRATVVRQFWAQNNLCGMMVCKNLRVRVEVLSYVQIILTILCEV